MTMNFIIVRDALITLLGNQAAGRFRVLGFQEQGQSAEEVKDSSRTAQVYYSQGDFPKSGASIITGPSKHNMTFKVDLTVSKAASCDLTIINDPLATQGDLAIALAASQEAVNLADKSLDELFNVVYQILMDARNIDFQLDRVVANRWGDNFQKNQPISRGELVVLTGTMQLTASIEEELLGDTPQPAIDGIDLTLSIDSDDPDKTGKAGVYVEEDYVIDRGSGNPVVDRDTENFIVERK